MKNSMMNEKELNVKIGDRVAVSGYRGTVIDVYQDKEKTNVRVVFDKDSSISTYGQYQGGWYSGFEIVETKNTKQTIENLNKYRARLVQIQQREYETRGNTPRCQDLFDTINGIDIAIYHLRKAV